MGPKKQLREERLRKKREAEKRRQEKIKNNGEQLEQEKIKRKLKYADQKKKGNIKLVDKMTDREKRQQRKKWRINTAKYRECLKTNAIDSITDEIAESSYVSEILPCTSDQRKASGRKKVRKDRAAAYRELKNMSVKLATAEKKCTKYRQRYYRLIQKTAGETEDTPRRKVRKLVQGTCVTPEIKRRLIFSYSISSQLAQNYKNMKTNKNKQLFDKVVRGKIMKKYKMLRESKMFLKCKAYQANKHRADLIYERKLNLKGFKIKEDVKNFLENDENSRLCPGKKDTVIVNKIKKQKRLLNNSLKILHGQFNKNHPYVISYSTFCRNKPYWIVHPDVDARNTCLCVKCEIASK